VAPKAVGDRQGFCRRQHLLSRHPVALLGLGDQLPLTAGESPDVIVVHDSDRTIA
jgi:hypothetical protein